MSSRVVVSGERLRNAASRLQLEMWLLCECGPSLREFMSSIMRWRSALTESVVIGASCLGLRWIDTSILKTGDLARYRRSLLVDSVRAPPRRRLSRSDLVQWAFAAHQSE